MCRSTTKSLLVTLLLCVLAFAGCGQKVAEYGSQEIVHLKAGEPAPWPGWLVSDAELEFLIKGAQDHNGD